jgi:ATP-binding cassette subfamily B protein
MPRLLQRIVDQGIARHDLRMIVQTSLFMIAVSVLGAGLIIGNTVLAVRVAQEFGHDLRSALFRKIQSLAFGDLDRLQTGQLMIRLSTDVTLVQILVMMGLRMLIRAPLMMTGSMILMVVTSRELAAIMLVLLPATLALVYIFATRTQPLFMKVQRKLDRLNTVLQENLAGVRVVKAFVRAGYEGQRFDQANAALTEQSIQVAKFMIMVFPTMALFLNLGTVAVLWFGGVGVIGGHVSVGQIMAFVNYLVSTMMPLTMLAMMVGLISAAGASAQRILEIMDIEPEIQNRPEARALSNVRGRVTFEDVSFGYKGDGGEPVLQHVNLAAEPGQNVAVLGATGSGKTSLVSLIPRFYDVTAGRVLVDGVDVRDVTMESLRAHIGMAMQETVLFRGTIRDNICYGRPDAGEDQVVAAAQAAQAHEFILGLPKGYDTEVGERGVTLSGGQKQRISIARALLVRPRILILDDSTSSVDVETEISIENALRELMKDRTSFIIAQRISTVLNADKIVVLEQGQIVAEGTHADLISSSRIYREIYDSQLGDGGSRHG